MRADLERILFTEAIILRRLNQLATQISDDYQAKELTVIAVLNGSLIFMADLLRRIPLPLKVDCLSVASYHGGVQSRGEVVFRQIALPAVTDRHVLLLDDILDSGTTLSAIRHKLESVSPRSVRLCVLLRKLKQRKHAVAPITSALTSRTNSWWVTAWTTRNVIATCRASACSALNW